VKRPIALATIFLVAAVIPAALRSAESDSTRRQAHVDQADVYAEAASIPSLAGAHGNELRVWQLGYKSGAVNGTIASAEGVAVYTSTPPGERATRFKSKLFLVSSTTSNRVTSLLRRLSELAKLDGRSIECGVMAGVGVYIDGSLDGRRFVIYAGTPSACDGLDAKLVASTVSVAREIAEAAQRSSTIR
jgi:hypothetical protein